MALLHLPQVLQHILEDTNPILPAITHNLHLLRFTVKCFRTALRRQMIAAQYNNIAQGTNN